MKKSTFKITKMDCPSEENMIRLKLSEFTDVRHLDFDIDNRILQVYHYDNFNLIMFSSDGQSIFVILNVDFFIILFSL